MSDLKSCPFCGCDKIAISRTLNYGRTIYQFHCWKCGAVSGCSKTEKGALEHWNTRPAEDALKAENEELCSTISGMEKTIGRAEKVLGERNLLAAEVERLKEALKQIAYLRNLNPDMKASKFSSCAEDDLRNFYCTMGDIAIQALGKDTNVPANAPDTGKMEE